MLFITVGVRSCPWGGGGGKEGKTHPTPTHPPSWSTRERRAEAGRGGIRAAKGRKGFGWGGGGGGQEENGKEHFLQGRFFVDDMRL